MTWSYLNYQGAGQAPTNPPTVLNSHSLTAPQTLHSVWICFSIDTIYVPESWLSVSPQPQSPCPPSAHPVICLLKPVPPPLLHLVRTDCSLWHHTLS